MFFKNFFSRLFKKNKWRVPTIEELKILIETELGNSMKGYYWSSSTHTLYPNNAWYVNFNHGYFSFFNKSNYNYVRCVRGGQNWKLDNLVIKKELINPTEFNLELIKTRFITKEDCILDQITGLEWELNPSEETFTWNEAIKYAEELNAK